MKEQKFAIYSRKSKFTGKGESIENQIELCKRYIHAKYDGISDDDIFVYEDEGYSGKNTNRPQFQEMFKAAKAHKFSYIICYKVDRISRSVGDFSILVSELEKLSIKFISVKEEFDTSTPMGKAMMNMCSVFAQLERETIAERISDNMLELAKSGRWLGGNTPTGYRSTQVSTVTLDGKTRKAYMLELIEEEAEIVKLIFSIFLQYRSLTKVETYLIQNRIRTKNGKDFTRFTIKGILTNPVYMIADDDAWHYFYQQGIELYCEKADFDGIHGMMAYNKTKQSTGKSHVLRNMSDWIITVGKHEGIIVGKDWIQASVLLDQNRSKAYRKPRSHDALLSGLLRCGDCGSFMRPKKSTRKNAEGEYIYSYLCEKKEKSKQQNCSMKNPNGNMLDKTVCEYIRQLSQDHSTFMQTLNAARSSIKNTDEDYPKLIEQKRKAIADNEAAIAKLLDALETAMGTEAYGVIIDRINALKEQNYDLVSQIHELAQAYECQDLSLEEFDKMVERLSSFGYIMDEMSVDEKRDVLRKLIRKVVWDGENVHIYLFGSDDDSEIDIDPGDETPVSNEPQGGDCKRMSDVPALAEENVAERINKRAYRDR